MIYKGRVEIKQIELPPGRLIPVLFSENSLKVEEALHIIYSPHESTDMNIQ